MSETSEGLLPLNSLQPAGLVHELKAAAERQEISYTQAVRAALQSWLEKQRVSA